MEQQPDKNNPISVDFGQVEFDLIEFFPVNTDAPEGWGVVALVKNNKCIGFVAFGPDGPLPGSFRTIGDALAAIASILNLYPTDDPEGGDRPPGG